MMVTRVMKLGHFLKHYNRSLYNKKFLTKWDQWKDADVVAYTAYIPHHEVNQLKPEMHAEEFALIVRTKSKKYIGILNGKEVDVFKALKFIEISKLEKLQMQEVERDKLIKAIVGNSI